MARGKLHKWLRWCFWSYFSSRPLPFSHQGGKSSYFPESHVGLCDHFYYKSYPFLRLITTASVTSALFSLLSWNCLAQTWDSLTSVRVKKPRLHEEAHVGKGKYQGLNPEPASQPWVILELDPTIPELLWEWRVIYTESCPNYRFVRQRKKKFWFLHHY